MMKYTDNSWYNKHITPGKFIEKFPTLKWTSEMNLTPIFVKVLNSRSSNTVKYDMSIDTWNRHGGVLIMNPTMIVTLMKEACMDPLSGILKRGKHTLICD